MAEPILVGKHGDRECHLLPAMATRHGLITGATGTGKTFTLQTFAEGLSRAGVPVFMADVKGDLTGISQVGAPAPKLLQLLESRGLPVPEPVACPVTLWDVFGEQGHPVRATVSDMGPLLLSRMLALNETQTGVLSLVFRIADDHGLALLDLKDLRAMLQHVGGNAKEFTLSYGNISAASIGAIQRGLLQIEEQGGDRFFGEPMLDIADFMQTVDGRGVVNILAADRLMTSPRLYAAFLLWLLSELFESLPEVGDPDKPKFVFFFDEAHLLFADAPKVLVERIELVVRLVRSKGVGVFFVTQNPLDVPDSVLGQLGNRVQHALRAFTPRDQKAVRAAASTMRANPELDAERAIMELAVGEALVSLLDDRARPAITERVFIVPPGSATGPIDAAQRTSLIRDSLVAGVYENAVDRESAWELLRERAAAGAEVAAAADTGSPASGPAAGAGSAGRGSAAQPGPGGLAEVLLGSTGPRGGRRPGLIEKAASSAFRTLGSTVGRELARGVLGSMIGGGRRR
jgi:uncharacterized protein